MQQTDQNIKLLEEAKRRMHESRKKVIRFNLLLILFFSLIIIGLAGAVYFFGVVKKQNEDLEKAKLKDSINTAIIKKQNDTLEYYTIRFKQLLNTGQIKDADSTLTKGVNSIVNSITTSNLDSAKTQSRDLAREFSEKGYAKLKNYDFRGALDAFNKSEKALNGYRESYEIYYLLHKNIDNLKDPDTQKRIMQKIQNDYNSKNILKASDIRQNK